LLLSVKEISFEGGLQAA